MEPFEFYLKKEFVKRVSPNKFRARFLFKDIEVRLKFMKQIDINKFPKIYFEHLYDINCKARSLIRWIWYKRKGEV